MLTQSFEDETLERTLSIFVDDIRWGLENIGSATGLIQDFIEIID